MRLPRPNGRHRNFYIALAVGLVALVVGLALDRALAATLAALLFALAYLVLAALDMPKLTPAFLRQHASDEDAPPFVVFIVTLAVLAYVTAALFTAINDQSGPEPWRLVLGIASVVAGWLMIHAMWAMHYAWEYYEKPDDEGAPQNPRGGLDFPGKELPDGPAFLYFALVIAMTAQTADVDIPSNSMRRIVAAHSLFSYLFNTVIIAAAVNIVVQLGQ